MSLYIIPAKTELTVSGVAIKTESPLLVELTEDQLISLENVLQTDLQEVDEEEIELLDRDDEADESDVDEEESDEEADLDEDLERVEILVAMFDDAEKQENIPPKNSITLKPTSGGIMGTLLESMASPQIAAARNEAKRINLAVNLFANILSIKSSPIVISEKQDMGLQAKVVYAPIDLDTGRVYEAACNTLVDFLTTRSPGEIIDHDFDDLEDFDENPETEDGNE